MLRRAVRLIRITSQLLLLLILLPLVSKGQIVENFPLPFQFFAADKWGVAKSSIALTNSSSSYKSFSLLIKQDSKVFSYQKVRLSPSQKQLFLYHLDRKKVEYSVALFEFQSDRDSTQIATSDKILCGDLFVLYGQSNGNAYAGSDTYGEELDDKWMRTFHPVEIPGERWTRAKKPTFAVGTLGLWLAKNVVEKQNVPVCIINGCEGGQNIQQLSIRNPNNPADPSTFYGRLLNRMQRAETLQHIKAFLWYQGEAETTRTNAEMWDYEKDFERLFSFIKSDFPMYEHLLIYQINLLKEGFPGYNDAGIIRQVQSNLSRGRTNRSTLATVGITLDYDGIHYGKKGYEKLADLTYEHLSFKIYEESKATARSPRLLKIVRHPESKSIALEFNEDQNLELPEFVERAHGPRYANEYIYFNDKNFQIDSFKVGKNKIYFWLKDWESVETVTYLPSFFTDYRNVFYDGPVIKNTEGFSALTFFKAPVVNQSRSLTYNDKLSFQIQNTFLQNCKNCQFILERWQPNNASYETLAVFPLNAKEYSLLETTENNRPKESHFARIRILEENGKEVFKEVYHFTPMETAKSLILEPEIQE